MGEEKFQFERRLESFDGNEGTAGGGGGVDRNGDGNRIGEQDGDGAQTETVMGRRREQERKWREGGGGEERSRIYYIAI